MAVQEIAYFAAIIIVILEKLHPLLLPPTRLEPPLQ